MSMIFNHEILEAFDIVPGFVPVDMQTADNNGQWVDMRYVARLLIVLFKKAGTAGDDPVFTVEQDTDGTGGAAKALTFTRIRKKVGAIGSTPQWTLVTQAAANTYTDTDSAEASTVMAVEIKPSDLDVANGFAFVRGKVPDIGANAQLGCMFYVAALRYEQATTPSLLS